MPYPKTPDGTGLSDEDVAFAHGHAYAFARPELDPARAAAYADWYVKVHAPDARTLADLPDHPSAYRHWEDSTIVRCARGHPADPVYAGHGEGEPYATGEFTCRPCGVQWRPAGHLGDRHGPEVVIVTVKVGGVERTVRAEVHPPYRGDLAHWPRRAAVQDPVVGVIGRGQARYPDTLLIDRLFDDDRPRPGTSKTTDQFGRIWTYHMGTCIRNRQARVVAWADVAAPTNYVDQARTSTEGS